MNKKFTDGPWIIGHRKNLVIGSNGGAIANCLFTHSKSKQAVKPTPDECMANAKLIAAAPELLKVLEVVVTSQGDSEARYGYGVVDLEVLFAARSAIAKAKGES